MTIKPNYIKDGASMNAKIIGCYLFGFLYN
jgi:hypothetical protein